jgi:hypothetical protein
MLAMLGIFKGLKDNRRKNRKPSQRGYTPPDIEKKLAAKNFLRKNFAFCVTLCG